MEIRNECESESVDESNGLTTILKADPGGNKPMQPSNQSQYFINFVRNQLRSCRILNASHITVDGESNYALINIIKARKTSDSFGGWQDVGFSSATISLE